uniref:Activator of basal transcription 1 n=1 Tax=Caenorhabditis tropicalis TaxID=1561998 RepID=A0A1I7TD13_9PELO
MAPILKKKRKVVKKSSKKAVTEEKEVFEPKEEIDKEEEDDEEAGTLDDSEIKPENPEKDEEMETEEFEDPELKQKKTGVVYFTMIPPKYNVVRIREYFEKRFPGEIGRIFLARNKHSKNPQTKYSEGWMELKKKKVAKAIAQQIDNTPIGGKGKDPVSSMLWNIRYLSGFKWVHLMEQLQYEKEVEKRRMNVEVAQARRIAAHFEEQIEKGKHLRKLEEKAKASGAKWDTFEREVEQKKAVKVKKERPKHVKTESNELMSMIFK